LHLLPYSNYSTTLTPKKKKKKNRFNAAESKQKTFSCFFIMVHEYAYISSRCVPKCIQVFMSTVSYISSVLSKSEMAGVSHTIPQCKLHDHPFSNLWVPTWAQTKRAMIFTGTSQGFRCNWNKHLFILTKH